MKRFIHKQYKKILLYVDSFSSRYYLYFLSRQNRAFFKSLLPDQKVYCVDVISCLGVGSELLDKHLACVDINESVLLSARIASIYKNGFFVHKFEKEAIEVISKARFITSTSMGFIDEVKDKIDKEIYFLPNFLNVNDADLNPNKSIRALDFNPSEKVYDFVHAGHLNTDAVNWSLIAATIVNIAISGKSILFLGISANSKAARSILKLSGHHNCSELIFFNGYVSSRHEYISYIRQSRYGLSFNDPLTHSWNKALLSRVVDPVCAGLPVLHFFGGESGNFIERHSVGVNISTSPLDLPPDLYFRLDSCKTHLMACYKFLVSQWDGFNTRISPDCKFVYYSRGLSSNKRIGSIFKTVLLSQSDQSSCKIIAKSVKSFDLLVSAYGFSVADFIRINK